MTTHPDDIFELLKKIRYDATAIQAKVTDALNALADLNLADQPAARCERCGCEFRGPLRLAEHVYQSHDGPLPEHWAALDERVIEPSEDDEVAA